MKKLISIFFFLKTVIIFAQIPCSSDIDMSILDNPPGCQSCDFPIEANNFSATPDTFDIDFACGDIENSLWFSVMADPDGQLRIEVEGSFCMTNEEGFEIGLYDSNLNRVGGCSAINSIRSSLKADFLSLTPYEYYFLMVDGKDSARCQFSIFRSSSIINDEIEATNYPYGFETCPGNEICYAVKNIPGLNEFTWSVSPEPEITQGGGLRDSFICLKFDKVGIFDITLKRDQICFEPKERTATITVSSDFTIQGPFERVLLCKGAFPYSHVAGIIDTFGFFSFTLPSSFGCDSNISVIVSEQFIIEKQDTILICEGSTLQIDSQVLTKPGIYSFLHEGGSATLCDSLYNLNLMLIDTSTPEINCIYDSLINKVGITWTKNPNVLGFDLKINDDLIRLGNRFTYLFTPTEPNQVLDISVTPFSDICLLPTAYAQCIGPSEVFTANKTYDKSNIEIFPNPTDGLINIQAKIPIEKIEVFDFSGRKISIDDFSKIDLSDEPSGVYIFKIKTSDGVFLRRTLKL